MLNNAVNNQFRANTSEINVPSGNAPKAATAPRQGWQSHKRV